MPSYVKKDFPVEQVRRFLEPGPIILVSSAYKGEHNVMTMGWHMILGVEPSLVGCYLWDANHSFDMVRKSKECVINIPEAGLAASVINIGNTSGRSVDKFRKFKLTAEKGDVVKAPLVGECYANFECKLYDASLINAYNLFVFEVVKAHVPTRPKYPQTLHYRGDGLFMIAGPTVTTYKKYFKPDNM